MSDLLFDWDEAKNDANQRKHAVSFEEAQTPQVDTMRDHYDFSEAQKNPYAKRLKKQVTIRLDESTLEYFHALASEMGIPYQTLINLYLRDCAAHRKKLSVEWTAA